MALNNYFPIGYQSPYFPQIQTPQPQPQQATTQSLIWVQGETGAKSYLVAPNSTVTLWDSESPTIYIKSTDASGIPSMRIFDYTERGRTEPKEITMEFAPISDFENLKSDVEEIKKYLKSQKESENGKEKVK